MRPVFVADIGNTRIKCALYRNDRIEGFVFPSDEIPEPTEFLAMCKEAARAPSEELIEWPWTVAAVVPKACNEFAKLLRKLRFSVRVVESYTEIPIKVDVDRPEQVGLDRLLSALAVVARLKKGGPAAIVSAGTAVTIDLVDSGSTFRGGVILPGLCMMAQALHDYTARLPMIESLDLPDEVPGRNTQSAILGGIRAAIFGAVDRVVEQYRWAEPKLDVYLTGGDAERVTTRYCKPIVSPILAIVGLTVVATDGATS